MRVMTAKEVLFGTISDLTEDESEDLFDFLNLHADPDELTEESWLPFKWFRLAADR